MATFYDAQPDQLLAWFQQIDTDRGGTLNVGEVQRALALAGLSFSGKFVNSLINLVDNDCSGQARAPPSLENSSASFAGLPSLCHGGHERSSHRTISHTRTSLCDCVRSFRRRNS